MKLTGYGGVAFVTLTIACGLIFGMPVALSQASQSTESTGLHFEMSFPRERSTTPQDGRIILIVSNNDSEEPRFRYGVYSPETQLGFGIDVTQLRPGEKAVIDNTTFGFPIRNVNDIPPGDYWVQAVLNRYETFHRSDGHTVKLPPDRGEGQQWEKKPGNFYSEPMKVHLVPGRGQVVRLELNQEVPPIPPPTDTPWVRYIRIQSDLLTEFWGKPTFLGAYVLLPAGFDENPDAHYPLAINQGHHPTGFSEFRVTPPTADMTGDDRIRAESAYDLYRKWTSSDFPRMLVVKIEHPTPYYDDSYAVNSANNGPYGDAIVQELIPEIESRFRGIGESWARVMFGGSTGGWESLAVQIFYPDSFNGAWSIAPDPVDFHQYEMINLYENTSAFLAESDWKHSSLISGRYTTGVPFATVEEDSHWEHVLGTRGRSGADWAGWQSVYSPVAEDGYPAHIWDPVTGIIDHDVARYWRDNYDLHYILERDWETLGPKLVGKIHIYASHSDTWYLNNAVYLLEEFLESTTDPYYGGHIEYGDRGHCSSKGHFDSDHLNCKRSKVLARTAFQYFIPIMAEHILQTAPPDADTSWRY